jgi:hypothetical protein
MRIILVLGNIWVIVAIMFSLFAVGGWVFDDPPHGTNRSIMFLGCLMAAIFWPLMIVSAGGRRKLMYIMKGE